MWVKCWKAGTKYDPESDENVAIFFLIIIDFVDYFNYYKYTTDLLMLLHLLIRER